jgi:short-subunit dehydrogenase involved in D-alanine esterification of teichoic acids
MNLTGNTVFITGGGSGIGRGFAETLHGKGNKVIISGRRKSALEEVGRANPGIEFVELDIDNPRAGTSSRPARHATAGVHRRNDQNLVDRCTRGSD